MSRYRLVVMLATTLVASACAKDGGPTGPGPITVGNSLTVNLVNRYNSNVTGARAKVTVLGPVQTSVMSDDTGQAVFADVVPGTYGVKADGFGILQADSPNVVVDKPSQTVSVRVDRVHALRISQPTPSCGSTVPYGSDITVDVDYSIAGPEGSYMSLRVFFSNDGSSSAGAGEVGTSFNKELLTGNIVNPVGFEGKTGRQQVGLDVDPAYKNQIKATTYVVATLKAMSVGSPEGVLLASTQLPCSFVFQ